MDREEAIKKHRRMWRLLAEHPEMTKTEAVGQVSPYPGEWKYADCFLCTWMDGRDCKSGNLCPVAWPAGHCNAKPAGLFYRWTRARGREKAALARQIAGLPEREPDRPQTRHVCTHIFCWQCPQEGGHHV